MWQKYLEIVPVYFVFVVLTGKLPHRLNHSKQYGGYSDVPQRPIHLSLMWLSNAARERTTNCDGSPSILYEAHFVITRMARNRRQHAVVRRVAVLREFSLCPFLLYSHPVKS